MDSEPPHLEDLQLGADHASLKARLSRFIDGFVGIFRQSVANEGFKAGPLTLKNVDLQKVHSIVNQIDSRRAFYEAYGDETLEWVLDSINEARSEIRQTMSDIWADSSQERIAQQLQLALSDFVTDAERLKSSSQTLGENFKEFERLLGDLRLKVWTLIAYLKIKNGDIIRPMHLPEEILEDVENARLP